MCWNFDEEVSIRKLYASLNAMYHRSLKEPDFVRNSTHIDIFHNRSVVILSFAADVAAGRAVERLTRFAGGYLVSLR